MIKVPEEDGMKRYFRGMELANQLDLEERRRTSPAERMRQICLWFQAARTLGVDSLATETRAQAEEEAFYKVWSKLHKGWRASRLARRASRVA